jgi:hypothetical protein
MRKLLLLLCAGAWLQQVEAQVPVTRANYQLASRFFPEEAGKTGFQHLR